MVSDNIVSSYEAKPDEIKKALLLYSGGLDTSCLVKWIQEEYSAEVITLCLDLGQPLIDLEGVKQKAISLGAKKAFVLDVKEEFAENYVSQGIKANALYEGKYPLSTALGRPLIAEKAIELALKEGADCIAHGCTGKGNDQVRLEASLISLDPEIKVLAPIRDWNMDRESELAYAEAHGIDVSSTNKKYSTDENLWGKSSECDSLEFPEKEPPQDVFELVTLPENAPDKPEYLGIGFEKGVPVSLNGAKMPLVDLIISLDQIAAKHGIGIIDHMEDRVVGLKSREVYECPAATCILEAHKDLEKFVCTIHENHFKPLVDAKWANLVYMGLWFDPLKTALDAFINKVNEKVSGTVKMKLYKGNALVVGRSSPNALYDYDLAKYEAGQTFNQKASAGFIELWSLQSKIAFQKVKENEKAMAKKQSIACIH